MMTSLVTKDELKECRNRVKPVTDGTEIKMKAKFCDEYTVSRAKARKNKIEEMKELERIEKEFEL